jgi:hypothetical protein
LSAHFAFSTRKKDDFWGLTANKQSKTKKKVEQTHAIGLDKFGKLSARQKKKEEKKEEKKIKNKKQKRTKDTGTFRGFKGKMLTIVRLIILIASKLGRIPRICVRKAGRVRPSPILSFLARKIAT